MLEHDTPSAARSTPASCATNPPRNRPLLRAAMAGALSLVAACTSIPTATQEAGPSTKATPHRGTTGLSPALADAAARIQSESTPVDIAERERARIYKGTGVVVKGQMPGGGLPPGQGVQPAAGGGVVLNFEGADLREVVRNVLGDILGESYTIDAAVGGQVTIRTSAGISREALPATLEMMLRMNGATMIKEAGVYKIVPSAAAVRGNVTPQLGTSNRALPAGFSVQIVPLRYVGVREMLRILEPFAKDAQAVRADDLRNLIVLAGTELELRHLLQTIEMFDIDWMAGMSAGVFTLQNADVKSVMQEFEKLVGTPQTSPFGGILRVVPIERMNALLVVTPNPQYLEEAKKWIERLDRGGVGEGPRLYVYHMQNSRAEKVAPLLQQAFTGRAAPPTGPPQPSIQPGTPPGTIVSPPAFQPQPGGIVTPPPAQVTITPPTPPTPAPREGTGIVRNLQAVADKDNNTIIVVATPVEYFIIEGALKRLDTPQRQVVIELTIAEVTLNDNLQFGVDFLFRDAAPSGRGFGGNVNAPILSTTGGAADAISGALRRGFSYLISNAAFPGGIQAALRLLDTYGNTKVIANPHLSALDNQKATIKVGDKIPICQQTVVGGTVNTNVTTTSQYIDTGVLVQVTPHINAGGLVTLDVQAEVSNPGAPANADPCTAPPIATRSVQTLLAVPSGRTMVMGGLIGERKQLSTAGLPLLARIPIIGGLFGEQNYATGRTELILFITPRVVESESDVRAIIDDLRRKMERLDEVFPGKPNEPAMTPR